MLFPSNILPPLFSPTWIVKQSRIYVILPGLSEPRSVMFDPGNEERVYTGVHFSGLPPPFSGGAEPPGVPSYTWLENPVLVIGRSTTVWKKIQQQKVFICLWGIFLERERGIILYLVDNEGYSATLFGLHWIGYSLHKMRAFEDEKIKPKNLQTLVCVKAGWCSPLGLILSPRQLNLITKCTKECFDAWGVSPSLLLKHLKDYKIKSISRVSGQHTIDHKHSLHIPDKLFCVICQDFEGMGHLLFLAFYKCWNEFSIEMFHRSI